MKVAKKPPARGRSTKASHCRGVGREFGTHGQSKAISFRPRLEILEDRCVPSNVNVWVAPGMSGNWNTAANWSLMHIPDSTDIATFNGSSAAVWMIDAPAMGTNTVSGVNITAAQMAFIYDFADLIIGADGFTQAASQFNCFVSTTITVAGDWSVSGSGVFVGADTVDFNSGTSQTILDNNNNRFFNLTHSGSGTLNLPAGPGVLQIANNFTNSSGTVDGKGIEIQMLDGNWMDTSNVVNVVTVWFYPGSPITQTIISNSDFNNLMYGSVPASAILRLLTPVTVTGNFDVSTNTFDANNQNMTVAGGWNNLSTVENTATVTFNGSGVQFMDPGLSPFNSLVHSGTGTLLLVNNDLTVNGTFDNSLGTFDANGHNVTITGLTTISAGAFQNSGSADKLTLTGGLDTGSATLSTGSGTAVLGADVTSSGNATISGNLDLGGANRTFTFTNRNDLDITALISNGGLTMDGPGRLFLSHANSYAGGTVINGGTVVVTTDGALGPGTGGTSIPAGGVLDFYNVDYTTAESVTLNGGILTGQNPNTFFAVRSSFAGSIFLGAAATTGGIFASISGGASTLTLNGTINAAGQNLLFFGDAPIYSGGTILYAGGTIIVNGSIIGTGTATVELRGGGTLELNAASTYGGGTTVSGTLIIGNDNALSTGVLNLGNFSTLQVAGGDHALGNNVTLNGSETIGASANTLTLKGVVSGPGSLIVNGNLNLNANNSYAGTTTVNAATLTLSSLFPLNGGGELILNSDSVLVPPTTSISISNAVTLNGPATLGGTTNFGFGGPITGPGSLTDMNPATVSVGGDSNFSGSIIVTVGTINFGGIAGTGNLVLDDGTILSLIGGGDRNPTPIPGSIVFNGRSTIEVSNAPILGGALSGPGGFTFVGGFSDWLILSGTSTYSGTTIVDGATLNVRGLQPNSPIVINNMGTLWGSGTVGDVTLNNGTLDPTQFGPGVVASTAILTTGNLKLNGGLVQFNAQGTTPGPGYNQLRVNGNVDLGPGVAAIHISSSKFPLGTQLRFIDNLGANPISGHFSLNPEGTVVFVGGNKLRITYIGGDGNDMVAIAITYGDIVGRVNETGQWWLGLSNASSFSNNLATSWSTAVTWVDVQSGDFNGNGFQDIVGRVEETGQWWVAVSNGSGGFTNNLWGSWSPAVTWVDVKVGDFDGDGKMDIVGRALETGQWWVAQSTGSSFTNSLWATWSAAATWVDVQVGDFNGDGKADITCRYLQGGQWWTALSTGSSFMTSWWGSWSTAVTWVDVNVGDFDGDRKADIVGRVLETGQWWVGLSNGSSFAASLWDTWSPAVTWVDVKVGDFNGDGKADITGRVLETGQWWTGISTGSAFATALWDSWSPAVTWVDVQVGDFNGDGKADITGRWLEGGSWWTAVSSGSSFTTTQWGAWSTAVTWVDVQNGAYV